MWKQYSLTVEKKVAEHTMTFFESLGACAITFQDAKDDPIFEPKDALPIWETTRVMALFDATMDQDAIHKEIWQHFDEVALSTLHVEKIEDEDWQQRCQSHFKPMSFGGETLWVYPSWERPAQPQEPYVELDPGLCFGTGSHATTRLCLEWLAQHIKEQALVIDYGCGSGILGIAALKLGARLVHAVDNDPQALQSTTENANKNHIAHSNLVCFLPEALPDKKADVVIANILYEPLLLLKDVLLSHVRPGGFLVLSGLLKEQRQNIIDHYQASCHRIDSNAHEDWCLVTFQV